MATQERTRYPRTDDDVLSIRRCPDCDYDIHPGWEHGRMPQPEGGSHVVCALQKSLLVEQQGPCAVCGVWSGRIFLDGVEHHLAAEHYGPVGDDHEAEPTSAPLAELITKYLDHRGIERPSEVNRWLTTRCGIRRRGRSCSTSTRTRILECSTGRSRRGDRPRDGLTTSWHMSPG